MERTPEMILADTEIERSFRMTEADYALSRALDIYAISEASKISKSFIAPQATDYWPGRRGKKFDRYNASLLYDSGMSDADIGRALRVTKAAIWKWRTRKALPPNVAQHTGKRRQNYSDLGR